MAFIRKMFQCKHVTFRKPFREADYLLSELKPDYKTNQTKKK